MKNSKLQAKLQASSLRQHQKEEIKKRRNKWTFMRSKRLLSQLKPLSTKQTQIQRTILFLARKKRRTTKVLKKLKEAGIARKLTPVLTKRTSLRRQRSKSLPQNKRKRKKLAIRCKSFTAVSQDCPQSTSSLHQRVWTRTNAKSGWRLTSLKCLSVCTLKLRSPQKIMVKRRKSKRNKKRKSRSRRRRKSVLSSWSVAEKRSLAIFLALSFSGVI